MIKPPGIIDNTIELPGRCYAIRMMPHEVDIADIHDKWDQAYADAMNLIVDGNVDEGKEILEELYRRKYNRAGHTLSYGYGAGWFGEPDPKKYLSLVYALVLKGYSAAFSDYGFCYDCGIGVKKSMRWALYWYRKAADLGVTAAMVNLAHILLFRDEKYKDVKQGLLYAFMAADYDDEEAQNILGLCYEEGVGVLKDYEKAYYWFQLAVKNGAGACAEHNLARCFRLGRGISEDKEMANKYEALAVKHGFHKKDKGIVI